MDNDLKLIHDGAGHVTVAGVRRLVAAIQNVRNAARLTSNVIGDEYARVENEVSLQRMSAALINMQQLAAELHRTIDLDFIDLAELS